MFELLMDYLYSSEFCTLRWEHRHNEPTNLCLKYDPPGNQEQSITEYFRTEPHFCCSKFVEQEILT